MTLSAQRRGHGHAHAPTFGTRSRQCPLTSGYGTTVNIDHSAKPHTHTIDDDNCLTAAVADADAAASAASEATPARPQPPLGARHLPSLPPTPSAGQHAPSAALGAPATPPIATTASEQPPSALSGGRGEGEGARTALCYCGLTCPGMRECVTSSPALVPRSLRRRETLARTLPPSHWLAGGSRAATRQHTQRTQGKGRYGATLLWHRPSCRRTPD